MVPWPQSSLLAPSGCVMLVYTGEKGTLLAFPISTFLLLHCSDTRAKEKRDFPTSLPKVAFPSIFFLKKFNILCSMLHRLRLGQGWAQRLESSVVRNLSHPPSPRTFPHSQNCLLVYHSTPFYICKDPGEDQDMPLLSVSSLVLPCP